MNPISIALIDDEAHVLTALARVLRIGLEPRPVKIHCFSDPLQVLEPMREHAIDLVICDYRMPGMDGLSVLRRLASSHPDAVRILLTGTHDMQVVLGAINDAGVSRVVLKPWNNYQLLDAVRASLKRHDEVIEERRLADQARCSSGAISAQEVELKRLEERWPGITKVEWTTDGWVQLGDTGLGPLDTPARN
jgi:two-component system, probable response regulator PhcQ